MNSKRNYIISLFLIAGLLLVGYSAISANSLVTTVYLPVMLNDYCFIPPFVDTFDSDNGTWSRGLSFSEPFAYQSGKLETTLPSSGISFGFFKGPIDWNQSRSVMIEGEFTAGDGKWGLTIDDGSKFWTLGITPSTNEWFVQRNDSSSPMVSGTEAGINAVGINAIEMSWNGSDIDMLVNGQQVYTFAHTSGGTIGVVGFAQTNNSVIQFDNFESADRACFVQ